MRLIGGEMLDWSDLGSPVRGEVLRPLLAAARGRTLVAGPHDPALLAALPAGRLTVLVRGVADAGTFGPDVTVLCGSLAKLTGPRDAGSGDAGSCDAGFFDTVIALDGLGRLRSAEDEPADADWADDLALLLAVLRPGGRLLLGLANPVGLHRLIALPPEPGDADWVAPDAHDPARPSGLAGLGSHLERAGLTVLAGYAAYPEPVAPTVLLGAEVLDDPGLAGYVEATLRSAVTPTGTVLADPRRLASDALHHGLAAGLAPGWVVLAEKGPAPPVDPLPEALIDTGHAIDSVRRDAAGRWVRRTGRPVPLGRNLHDLLLTAAQRRDQPAVRGLLAAWQRGPAAGVAADRIVVDAAGDLHPLAAAGTPADALRRLAATMTEYAHLWPTPADETGLTALLAAMAGLDLDPGPGPAVDQHGVRELVMTRDRLLRELAEARARHEWYEKMLAARFDELRRLRRINAVLAATVPGRAAAAGIDVLRAGRRAVRRWRPRR
jgi:hypothetical protein